MGSHAGTFLGRLISTRAPPVGRHRYFHKLYALDAVLPGLGAPAKDTLLQAMRGNVLAESQLVGTYEMSRKK
jgi:phosphatidylethanolamine-binding protein (PEBP) family uncharacterized protein